MWEDHPLQFVKSLIDTLIPANFYLEFARYRYIPETDTSSTREIFHVKAGLIDEVMIRTLIQCLPNGCELALQSRVYNEQGLFVGHLFLIDFLGTAIKDALKITTDNPTRDGQAVRLYNSGRSFHGYIPCLLEHSEWEISMDKLMLANKPSYRFHPVDQRWVAHSILAGYSSLRWSCNTPRHKHLPKLTEVRTLEYQANIA